MKHKRQSWIDSDLRRKKQLKALIEVFGAVNIVDKETDGDVSGHEEMSVPARFPENEEESNPDGAGETSHHMPRQAQTQQLDEYSCGPAALYGVLLSFGIDIPQEELKEQLHTSEEGTTPEDMIEVVRKHGLGAEVIKDMTHEELATYANDDSVIVYYQDHDGDHYATLDSIDEGGVNLFDPMTDDIKYIDWPEFEDRWNGKFGDHLAIAVCQTKQAEIGQGLSQLTTERETGKTRLNSTEPSRWNESYHDDNQFEDKDLKLGESETDDVDPLSTPVSPPYTDGIGCLDSRYEDASPKQRNIILHAAEQTTEKIDPNKGPRQFWVAVDLDGTILEPPPEGIYQDQSGEHRFGEPLAGSREALQELVDGGARVSIYTARQYFAETPEEEIKLQEAVERVLAENQIPYTDIYIGKKPPAHYYIDDKGVTFKGDWSMVIDAVRDKLNKYAADDQVKDQKDYKGIKIDIEWPKGSIRSYEGDDTYVTHMKCDYGYAKGVEGTDADSLDIYLGDADSDTAYVVEQLKEDGSYDEDKLMVGFLSEEDAADMYLQHMPAYMLGDIREVPIDKLKNALYGQPEDRRGEEDLVPSEEKTADVFNPKINKKTKSDYVGPQTSQVGGIGGVAADSEDVCECGHSREEHDGAGCFADPEKCQCTKQPGMFDGEKDEISKKKPNYLFVYGTLRQGEPYYEKYLKDSKFVRNVKTQPKYHLVVTQAAGMVEGESAVEGELYEVPDEVMAEIDKYEHPYFRQEIELEDGSTAYAYFVPEEVSEVVEEAPRMHSPASDVESSVFPSDKDDENLNTDPDETFENRDIRRDPLTERSKYAGRKT